MQTLQPQNHSYDHTVISIRLPLSLHLLVQVAFGGVQHIGLWANQRPVRRVNRVAWSTSDLSHFCHIAGITTFCLLFLVNSSSVLCCSYSGLWIVIGGYIAIFALWTGAATLLVTLLDHLLSPFLGIYFKVCSSSTVCACRAECVYLFSPQRDAGDLL